MTLATDKPAVHNGLATPWFAVYHWDAFWLTDTCAGGSWSETVEEAEWFATPAEAYEALTAAEIDHARVTVCRVR